MLTYTPRRAVAAQSRTTDPTGDPLAALVSNKRGAGTTRALAPAPVVDRYPIVIGSNLSLTYLSSVYRLCTTGWRYAYVDALNELLEHDPHVRGTIRQRVLPVAGATLSVVPATLPKGDEQESLAKEIAEEVQRQLDNLPSRAQSLGQLAWGSVYGVAGSETEWERTPGAKIKWEARRLHNIHSRRLNYPNPTSWDVYIWDQGSVGAPGDVGLTMGPMGLRVADYPGKFVIYTPALNGDYPTRDGEGRYIAFYMAIKRMVVRCTANDFERTIRPWVLGTFNRELDGASENPIADDEDRAMGVRALTALGTGSMNYALIPNSIKIRAPAGVLEPQLPRVPEVDRRAAYEELPRPDVHDPAREPREPKRRRDRQGRHARRAAVRGPVLRRRARERSGAMDRLAQLGRRGRAPAHAEARRSRR